MRFKAVNSDVILDIETGFMWGADGSVPPIGDDPGGRKPWSGPLLSPPDFLANMRTGCFGPIEDYKLPDGPYGYPVFDYIDALNKAKYGGFSDWRLPNINELASLIDWEIPHNHFWLMENGFRSLETHCNFWSSTTCNNHPEQAWHVHFTNSGNIHTSYKAWCAHYILPVRGKNYGRKNVFNTDQTKCYGPETVPEILAVGAGRGQDGDFRLGSRNRFEFFTETFTFNFGNATINGVIDRFLNLVWATDVSLKNVYFEDAMAFARLATESNALYTTWRLPSCSEFASLMSFGAAPLFQNDFFKGIPAESYWSGTVSANNPNFYWIFHPAMGFYAKCKKSERANVWLCHDLPKAVAVL